MRVAMGPDGAVGRYLGWLLGARGHVLVPGPHEQADALVLPTLPGQPRGRRLDHEQAIDAAHAALAAARRAGTPRVILLSALGAMNEPAAPALRARWLAEAAARDSGLGCVVLRPGLVYGAAGDPLQQLAGAVAAEGPGALRHRGAVQVQPLHVGDLGEAVHRCLASARSWAGTHEVGGPEHVRLDAAVSLAMVHGARAEGDAPAVEDTLALLAAGDVVTRRDAVPRVFGFTPRSLRQGLAPAAAAAPAAPIAPVAPTAGPRIPTPG